MTGTPGYFQGKTIVITGAASGIGRATAQIFTREGANVVACDIDGEGNENTVEIIRQTGGRALAVATDVTRREDVDAAVAEAIREFGRIDFMFNCAGAAVRRSAFLDIDDDLWRRTWAINVNGVLYGMQAVLPHMLENGRGVIVNVASMSHKRGGPGTSVHYASAKGAVLTMTLGVAREFAGRGIRCLSISPGPVETPFQAAAATTPDTMATFLSDVPMGRFGKPEEIGELVLFMCSDACEFVTTGRPEFAFRNECERDSRSCQTALIKGLSEVSAHAH